LLSSGLKRSFAGIVLASGLLALAIEQACGATESLSRVARPRSRDEPGEPAVGCAAHSRRAAQAGLRGRPVDRGQVHGPTPRTAIARLEDFPSQSRPAYWCD